MTFRRLVFFVAILAVSAICGAAAKPAAPAATTPAATSTDAAAYQMPSVVVVPPEARASASFDPEVATNAYLAQIPPAAKARSDAYFEGGYWLVLWDFLYGALILVLLLNFRWSAGMRDRAVKMTRFKTLQIVIYWLQYLVVTAILGFPLAVYEGYFREHKYGMATQTFGPWMGDHMKDLMVDAIIGSIGLVVLFSVVRWLPRTWHIWGALVTVAGVAALALIAPVFIFPLFNKVTRLNDPKITVPIISMARANGIPVKDVFEIDASKQTTRMSANVSGLGSTMRITLNDNLLRRGSPEEIQAVMGHEMGHYVLNHVYKDVILTLIEIVAIFGFLRWALEWSLKRWGEKWKISGIGDVAVLPLALLLLSIVFFVITPISNTQVRVAEQEADMYGLNASRQPDGFAQAAIHLGEYRKMSPGPIEEWIFFDHPSGHRRIMNAMRWKAENLKLFEGK